MKGRDGLRKQHFARKKAVGCLPAISSLFVSYDARTAPESRLKSLYPFNPSLRLWYSVIAPIVMNRMKACVLKGTELEKATRCRAS